MSGPRHVAVAAAALELDLPPLVAAFARRLHEAGLPMTPERTARFASALALARPVARTRLYWTARAVLVSDPSQVKAFDAVFFTVFGGLTERPAPPPEDAPWAPAPPDEREAAPRREAGAEGVAAGPPSPVHGTGARGREPEREVPVPVAASDEERLRGKRFDALEPGELAQLYKLMARLEIATPKRRTRRADRARRGEHVDLRRTLRGALRTGGDPSRLARRRRRVVPRRIVLLCDISGSMEPYARAYLQFLACARQAEAFVFATRLTRITRALATRSPERAIQRAAAAAPDWSSGTRIGEALRAFNDRHGRRGMARGAVIVIISDGWERGEPELVAREMQRLSRLAYRIVWVNPRASASGFAPRVGGMAAALPHIDALVSGHSLEALGEVAEAIAAERTRKLDAPEEQEEDEPWASATPVAGSSVAMPSGYGPSRGRTTPGW
ncbi:vWA domain-containing protein [Candidatus Solirubrobacter pratensis]|uniref:vWA domain-containing protein n=1 Tax=Candidatus Solirubrobacter pratensis TaxID=1298857 RepID=UPI00040018A4|nr:VWA domain-containing protein [Candidatus Solirubrobacter pratensis]